MRAPTSSPDRLASTRPLICLITDRRAFRPPPEVAAWEEQLLAISAAAQSGCQLIQIREKDLAAGALASHAREAIEAAAAFGALVLVNDRLDVALAVGAAGVHLPASSLSVAEARALAGRAGRDDFLIGASVHSLSEARAAEGADLLICGPVYETPSKRAYGPPLGLARLAEICAAVEVPVLAIGGLRRDNFRAALEAGAAGLAAITLFTDLATIRETVRALRAG